jgi:hypothetical protein
MSLGIENRRLSHPVPRRMKPTDMPQAIQTEYQIKHLQNNFQVFSAGVES